MGRIGRLLAIGGLALLSLSSCLNVQPKALGGRQLGFEDLVDVGSQASFRFNFAWTSGATSVYLQGATNSKSALISTCNLAGTGCVCEFLNAAGTVIYTTSSSQIRYDEQGNYYRCAYSGAAPVKVRIKNIAGDIISENLTVYTTATITLAQLIGPDLDTRKVRSVYRYACEFNYLQKAGTSTQIFDCSAQTSSCDPDLNGAKHFCLLRARFPFYLYTDLLSSNFSQKISDRIYNGDGICGLQIKQFDCVGPAGDPYGTPVKRFGLYNQIIGYWQRGISLPAGPSQAASVVGYAPVPNSTGECPPVLEKRIFFLATVVTSDLTPSHNFVNNQIATEVELPSAVITPFHIGKKSGGTGGACDGTSCTLPTSEVLPGAKTDQPYTSAGSQEFCVIPLSLL